MTLTEFKAKIDGITDPPWWNGLSVNINYSHIKYQQQLSGITAIYEFILQQTAGWDKLGENLPKELEACKNQFNAIKERIIHLVSQGHALNTRTSLWNQINSLLLSNSPPFFTYNCPETDFLINLYKEQPAFYQGAYALIIGSLNNILNNKNHFAGTVLASNFLSNDFSQIASRFKSEKKSISQIRDDFQKYLTESESEVSAFKDNLKSKSIEYSKAVDDTLSNKQTSFDTWFTTTKQQFMDFNTSSNATFKDLVKTYEELLRLQKPAEYWSKRAIALKAEGWLAVKWLVSLVIFACITLYCLLWLTPEGMLLSFIKGEASAIKWSIIYVTFISFLAYGIRTLNKLVFSSFHLARDAEEREQLTYFYLALIQDKNVDEKDRHLIMQSLFSRADTGLLKEDSSPSMPGNYIEKVFNGK